MEGGGNAPRLLAAFWCLAAVVLTYAYVGSLVSFLSVPKVAPIIDSLDDLPSSKLRWTTQSSTAIESLFLASCPPPPHITFPYHINYYVYLLYKYLITSLIVMFLMAGSY